MKAVGTALEDRSAVSLAFDALQPDAMGAPATSSNGVWTRLVVANHLVAGRKTRKNRSGASRGASPADAVSQSGTVRKP